MGCFFLFKSTICGKFAYLLTTYSCIKLFIMQSQSKIKLSSNRSFGLVFFVFFLIIALWPLKHGHDYRLWSVILSIVFFILGILNSKLLTPLNKIWFKFGMYLGAIVSPIVMGVVYFIVVTPIGLLMRFSGKNLLNLNKDKDKNLSTYWTKRQEQQSSMKNQF